MTEAQGAARFAPFWHALGSQLAHPRGWAGALVGHVMGLQTIAEHVETAELLQELQHIGVNFAQGNHIGLPVELEMAQVKKTDDRFIGPGLLL